MQQALHRKLLRIPLLPVLTLLVLAPRVLAQSISSARINEVMVHNEDNYIDSYGKRSPWIEIYNSSAGTIDLAGCYLTNDPADLKMYMIPKGDIRTSIKPRQSVVFFADNLPLRGTFHLNFTLTPDESHYLALISSDGTSILDDVEVPANLPVNYTYARVKDGQRTEPAANAWHITQHTTPGSNNDIKDENEKIDRLDRDDPKGFVMTITAMLVVFLGLLLLFLAYELIGIIAMRLERNKQTLYNIQSSQSTPSSETTRDPLIPVVIALTLSRELELNGGEAPGRLTIHPRTQLYSPWSDKGQMMRQSISRKHSKD